MTSYRDLSEKLGFIFIFQ